MNDQFSISPDGVKYRLPDEDDCIREIDRLTELVETSRHDGMEIVVVMGVGFVGAVMAAIVADTVDKKGKPSKFVIGMQRPSARSYWKIPKLNEGISPVKAEDPEVDPMIHRCVLEKKTLTATFTYDALKFADVVIVDIQLDYMKNRLGNVKSGHVEMSDLEESFDIIASHIKPDCLVLIETTVAPGTTEQIAYPAMKKIFRKRGIESNPLLAHSYERVMPGRDYVASIRDFWRVCSGVDELSKERVKRFLTEVLNTEEFPLTILDRPIESETAKIVENSYRATILAFLDEWSKFAEQNGVDIIKVIKAIKVRPTHSNMIFPGPGIGGYCLPKDGGLGVWAYRHILGFEDDLFKITPKAIDINDTRPLHAAQLVRDALRNMGQPIASAETLILGASYREDVGDTRYSGSEVLIRRLADMGAEIRSHDPYVDVWWEFKNQENYSENNRSLYFRNQKKLRGLVVLKDLATALKGIDALVLAVRHEQYLNLDPDEVVCTAGKPIAVIDCFGILDDNTITRYLELGCEVKGLGRGHIRRLKEEIGKRHRKSIRPNIRRDRASRLSGAAFPSLAP
ncbi:MAG: nucleotide sugar dehydrogenase [Syntrophorhabdaceae bacterium]|nr:nucleotide sugar dehydrogenase [Syntrophorhabdaceae bacterium]MDD4195609.1 nucleotide sugar dehydrogenase [Syntrophorhabdaceae bacterium]